MQVKEESRASKRKEIIKQRLSSSKMAAKGVMLDFKKFIQRGNVVDLAVGHVH